MQKQPERIAQTQQDFMQAFWRLFADNPIEHITVAQLCQAAGYHRGTFYLHFHSIYDLLDASEAALLDETAACVEKCMKSLAKNDSKLARLNALKDVVLFYERNKRYLVILLGAQGDPSFTPRMKDKLKPLWRRYIVSETVTERHSEREIDLLLEYTLAGSLYMISGWLQDPGDISAYDLGRLVYDAAFRNNPVCP